MDRPAHQQPDQAVRPLYITLILDESGSMQSCKGAALAGFNHYLATLRREPAGTHFTLTLFNAARTEVRYRAVPLSAVQDLDEETYRPQDGTPLYDAIGRTLSLARQEAPAEARKLCVILTDGEENASQEYSRQQVFDLIKSREKQGWAFLYLGADHDVWAAGGDLGIAGESRISFSRRRVDHTFDQLSEATARYRRGEGESAAEAFTPQERPPSPASPSGNQEPPDWLS
ncbi:VWA domain-containing protein [Nitrospira sp. NS4]|uniref:VWA domain-containing protein n=1 Tax=Nitrospira sp. NS4 TaxID=3414498 RepID=UPI003C2E12F1